MAKHKMTPMRAINFIYTLMIGGTVLLLLGEALRMVEHWHWLVTLATLCLQALGCFAWVTLIAFCLTDVTEG